MKIINKNLNSSNIGLSKNNLKTVNFNPKLQDVHKVKYLPAFSKEWKNVIYSFNKNNLRNLGSNTLNINKIIKGYFNLFFKNSKYLGKTKFRYLTWVHKIWNSFPSRNNESAVLSADVD